MCVDNSGQTPEIIFVQDENGRLVETPERYAALCKGEKMTDLQCQAQRVKKVLRRAVAAVLERKWWLGQYAVIFRDGKPVGIQLEQLTSEEVPSHDPAS